jgi:hypothetical protein
LNAPCAVCNQKFSRFDIVPTRTEARLMASPRSLELHLFPNPARFSSRITYSVGPLPHGSEASLTIYNLQGQPVTSWSINPNRGDEVLWTGTDRRGNVMPAGLYVVKLQAGQEVARHTLVLMR